MRFHATTISATCSLASSKALRHRPGSPRASRRPAVLHIPESPVAVAVAAGRPRDATLALRLWRYGGRKCPADPVVVEKRRSQRRERSLGAGCPVLPSDPGAIALGVERDGKRRLGAPPVLTVEGRRQQPRRTIDGSGRQLAVLGLEAGEGERQGAGGRRGLQQGETAAHRNGASTVPIVPAARRA